MSEFQTQASPGRSTVEIKGSPITLPIIKLRSVDVERLAVELTRLIAKSPDFFRNAPVVLDLADISAHSLDFPFLCDHLAELALRPIGVRNASPGQTKAAQDAGLATLADSRTEHTSTERPAPSAPRPARDAGRNAIPPAAAKIITQPVRSGQRIYAQGTDLIVLAPVSPGAEIMADGNIHVYHTLRGRALAGVRGNLDCRIFCRDLQAELVSVAGHYRISENLEEDVQGRSVQIFLQDDALLIEAL